MTKEITTTIKNPKLVKNRHEQILQAAVKLFSRKGYHMTTLREISKEAGIGLGNLYDYIGSKSDILYILYQRIAEIIFQEMDRIDESLGPLARLMKMVEVELSTMDRYQDLVMIVYQEGHAMDRDSIKSMLSIEKSHIQRYQEVLEEGIKSEIYQPINTVALANIIKVMIDGWVLKRWSLKGQVSLGEMKALLLKIVCSTIMQKQNNSDLKLHEIENQEV
jgi:AcrR family transcriptional regulator